ncbi:MAG: XRE family transcriptional regulator [Hyphomicrobiales bacterium]|nr:MAG: XRE family transcriptional regulator [Hyphomicrobiales bacterium]
MTDLYQHIGSKIRDLRLKHDQGTMSQEVLGEKLGVASNTVSRWETGTYKPTAEDLDKLSRLFGVSITVFFPNMAEQATPVQALTSATSGLNKKDLEEVLRYAAFRKAERALEGAKRARPKK